MDTTRDPTPACAFCDGSGLWTDVDGDAAPDPCPLCDGSGRAPAVAPATADAADGDPLLRLLGILGALSQAERQRLYEELYARYDCRIYR